MGWNPKTNLHSQNATKAARRVAIEKEGVGGGTPPSDQVSKVIEVPEV